MLGGRRQAPRRDPAQRRDCPQPRRPTYFPMGIDVNRNLVYSALDVVARGDQNPARRTTSLTGMLIHGHVAEMEIPARGFVARGRAAQSGRPRACRTHRGGQPSANIGTAPPRRRRVHERRLLGHADRCPRLARPQTQHRRVSTSHTLVLTTLSCSVALSPLDGLLHAKRRSRRARRLPRHAHHLPTSASVALVCAHQLSALPMRLIDGREPGRCAPP